MTKYLTTAAVAGSAAAALLVPAGAAHAAVRGAPAVTKTKYNLSSVGSDAVYCVDQAIYTAYNTKEKTGAGNTVYEVPPLGGEDLGCGGATPSTVQVPADTVHKVVNFSATGNTCTSPLTQPILFPNGSGPGQTCYADDNGAGNIAFTRSASAKSTSVAANFDYWAFALDAVDWTDYNGSGSNGTYAPKTLTPSQLNAIYTCQDTNWKQVGGSNTPIVLDFPQSGSGVGKTFAQAYLNNVYPGGVSGCNVNFVEQNDGNLINPTTGTPQASTEGVIYMYSYGVFTAQTNGTETSLTNGSTLGEVSGTTPSTGTIKESAALVNATPGSDACASPVKGLFCGSDYLFHVSNQQLPASYLSAVLGLIGVPATGTAPATSVCDNTYSKTITSYGFIPLKKATTAESTSSDPVPGSSFCRQF